MQVQVAAGWANNKASQDSQKLGTGPSVLWEIAHGATGLEANEVTVQRPLSAFRCFSAGSREVGLGCVFGRGKPEVQGGGERGGKTPVLEEGALKEKRQSETGAHHALTIFKVGGTWRGLEGLGGARQLPGCAS